MRNNRSDTLVLKLKSKVFQKGMRNTEFVEQYLQKQCLVDWPYYRLAKIVRIENEDFEYHLSQNYNVKEDPSSKNWREFSQQIRQQILTVTGVDCGTVDWVVEVQTGSEGTDSKQTKLLPLHSLLFDSYKINLLQQLNLKSAVPNFAVGR